MSGSTENLLVKHSDENASRESIDVRNKADSRRNKTAKQDETQGLENRGYTDNHKDVEVILTNKQNDPSATNLQSDETLTSSREKRDIASPSKELRRHSSPDKVRSYHHGKHRERKNVARQRAISVSEVDLRRKAVLNSMRQERRFQSANHLAVTGDNDEVLHSPSEQQKDQQSHKQDDRKTRQEKKQERAENNSLYNSATLLIDEHVPSSPRQHQHGRDVLEMEKNVLSLEKSQLGQYKRRITLALNERTKLAEQLKVLSLNLTDGDYLELLPSPRDAHMSISPRTPRSHSDAHMSASPRTPRSLGERKNDLFDEYPNRHLPDIPIPDRQTHRNMDRRHKTDLEELDSSRDERVLSKRSVRTESSQKYQTSVNGDDSSSRDEHAQENKEDLQKMVDGIWHDHLTGDILAEDREGQSLTNPDVNNNKTDENRKPLSVEEFLAPDEQAQDDTQEKEQPRYVEWLNKPASRISPELYEPLAYNFPELNPKQHIKEEDDEHYKNPTNQKMLSHHYENTVRHEKDDPDEYYIIPTLPTAPEASRKESAVEQSAPLVNDQPRSTRFDRDARWFGYMTPYGGTNDATNHTATDLQRAPSDLSDKLRYYREKATNRSEENKARDLTDAFAHEQDPEKKREIQQQAAAEAALLRREASALLWEAMNLERICDPNGRVRHVYLPH